MRRLRRRYGRARLTADVLPYRGHGIMDQGEYKAHLAFLRAVQRAEENYGRDKDPWAVHRFLDASVTSNEYMGAMAALRGGLVRQQHGDGPLRLTSHGREYLGQRG